MGGGGRLCFVMAIHFSLIIVHCIYMHRHEPCPNGALDLANAAATGSKENAGTAATMAEVRGRVSHI